MKVAEQDSFPQIKLDLRYLQDFSKGDKEFEKDMLISSLEDIDEKMEELKLALAIRNTKGIRHIAHSLKSLCSIIGVAELFFIFKNIEQADTQNFADNFLLNQPDKIDILWLSARENLIEVISTDY